MGVMIIVMLRPYVLRHTGHDAQEKSDQAIEPAAAEQAAVAALVHQAKSANVQQDDEGQRRQGEPGRYAEEPDRRPPEECERYQGREELRQASGVFGLAVLADHGALLASQAVIRLHDSAPARL